MNIAASPYTRYDTHAHTHARTRARAHTYTQVGERRRRPEPCRPCSEAKGGRILAASLVREEEREERGLISKDVTRWF